MSRLDRRLPSIAAMEAAAARRAPRFAFDYLRGGIGRETCLRANRRALDAVALTPRYMHAEGFEPELGATILSRRWPLPIAPGPIGLSGLMWPRAAELVAAAVARRGLPMGLSSYATSSIEEIGALVGDKLWFQLYCTIDPAIEDDLMARAAAAGCETLIATVDIPGITRRERDVANGLSVPPRFDLSTLLGTMARPRWSLATLAAGAPRFRTLERYVPKGSSTAEAAAFLSGMIDARVTEAKLERVRERWTGRLIVKGVLSPDDALRAREIGADAVVVSNHGGRQFDAAPTSAAVLPAIRAAVGPGYPLLADGGVRSALDAMRLIALGADFVPMGRAFVYAVAAGGEPAVDRLLELLETELRQNMIQLGCPRLADLGSFLTTPT